MQGQYQPRAPGIAAGQSNRDTLGTYFDYQGILRTARPKELRPNFVYQNGIWVQQGFLREAQATNFFQYDAYNAGRPDIAGGNSAGILTDNGDFIKPVYSGLPDLCVGSAIIHIPNGQAKINCACYMYYFSSIKLSSKGDIIEAVDDDGQGHAGRPSAVYLGNGYFRAYFPRLDGYSTLGKTSFNLWIDRPSTTTTGDITISHTQVEAGRTPTSVIYATNTAMTRAAD